jgi:hypothetical protein
LNVQLHKKTCRDSFLRNWPKNIFPEKIPDRAIAAPSINSKNPGL